MVSALAVMLIPAISSATPFVCSSIPGVGGTIDPSLVVTPSHTPAVAFASGGHLLFSTKPLNTWNSQQVITTSVVQSPSLAYNAAGDPRIAYHPLFGDDSLLYIERNGDAWTTPELVDLKSWGQDRCLAIDANGDPHVCYTRSAMPNAELVYARKTGGIWVKEVVGAYPLPPYTEIVDLYPSMVLVSGLPIISFYDWSSGDLKYAARSEAGVWTVQTVDVTGNVGKFTSLAYSAGLPHIGYYDASNGHPKYATLVRGLWSTETVDMRTRVGLSPSIAIVSGVPRMAYYDSTNQDLKFAVRTGPGSWQTEVVEHIGPVSNYQSISLAIDDNLNPIIAYRINVGGIGNSVLRFADAGVHILGPIGGETWYSGSVDSVTWSGLGAMDVQLSPDGVNWTTVASGVSGGSTSFTVPSWNTATALARVVRSDPVMTSTSAGPFSILPPPGVTIAVAYPYPGINMLPGRIDSVEVAVMGGGAADSIVIELSKDAGASYPIRLGKIVNVPLFTTGQLNFFVDPSYGTNTAQVRATAYNQFGSPGIDFSPGTFTIFLPAAVEADASSPAIRLDPAVPNPSNPAASIRFATERDGPVSLTIYSVTGAMIRRLVIGRVPAGPHEARWDGLDENGRPAGSGTYLVRLASGGEWISRKLTLLR